MIPEDLLTRFGRLEGIQEAILASLLRIEENTNLRLGGLEQRLLVLENFKLRVGVLAAVVTTGCSGVGLFASDIVHYFIGKH